MMIKLWTVLTASNITNSNNSRKKKIAEYHYNDDLLLSLLKPKDKN